MITTQTLVSRNPDQVSTVLDGQTVLLNIESGLYFKMDKTGTRIWDIIEKQIPVSDICSTLMAEYDVNKEMCEDHVLQFLNSLQEKGLLITATP